jgi:hypothetical protein
MTLVLVNSISGLMRMIEWLPVIAALSAMVRAISELFDVRQRRDLLEAIQLDMRAVKVWWLSLTFSERCLPEVKSYLVEATEDLPSATTAPTARTSTAPHAHANGS